MADEYTEKIGEALRQARRAAGLSQSKASSAAGIDQASISDYENGKSEPRLRSLVALADAYGARPGDLLEALGSRAALAHPTSKAEAPRGSIEERLTRVELELETLKRKVQ